MSDVLVCFSCCITEQPPTTKRRRIDRTMIGGPTNFVHTGHIGSGDMMAPENNHLNSIQTQMSSKGGYDPNNPDNNINIDRKLIDIKRIEGD